MTKYLKTRVGDIKQTTPKYLHDFVDKRLVTRIKNVLLKPFKFKRMILAFSQSWDGGKK